MDKETSESEKKELKKDSILKILAIAGFLGIIIFIAWTSIQLVSVVPSAFSSLASLAESVNDSDNTDEAEDTDEEASAPEILETLVVTSNTLLATAGEPVTINWNTARANGSYVFSYDCADGVAIDLVSETGLQSIQCENNYNLGSVDSATITIDSEKNRYTDIDYNISFLKTDDTQPRATGSAPLTVFNQNISAVMTQADNEQESEDNSDVPAPETETPASSTEPTAEPEVEIPVTPTPSPTPVTTEFTQEYTYAYEIPTSDPNGTTDLAARYLFVGEIVNNRFVPGAIAEQEAGAIQFEVKNIGTKTSKTWSFTLTLPGDKTYESSAQSPLKPNERAILTVGFSGAEVTSHTFDVTVDVAADRNQRNNDFSQRIQLVD